VALHDLEVKPTRQIERGNPSSRHRRRGRSADQEWRHEHRDLVDEIGVVEGPVNRRTAFDEERRNFPPREEIEQAILDYQSGALIRG